MRDSEKVTRLESFLRKRGIKPAHLAREARMSRQHLLRLRKGVASPTVGMIVRIANAASRLVGRVVRPSELFRGVA